MEARSIFKALGIITLSYFLIPSYAIAIAIHMPFPNILFPPIGKYFMYDVNNYSCMEQSHEIEEALEKHGIHTYIMDGYKLKSGKLEFQIRKGRILYGIIGDYDGHEWIEIDLGIVKIPFDAVSMLPLNPDWFIHYNLITKMEGGWRVHEKLDERNESIDIVKIS